MCPLHKILKKKQKDLILKLEKLPPINTTHLGKRKRATCHVLKLTLSFGFPILPHFAFSVLSL